MKFAKNLAIAFILFPFVYSRLEFQTKSPLHSGYNFPLGKQKTNFDKADSLGEDASSLIESGSVVCDGVGGSDFLAYFLAELFSIAGADFHLRYSQANGNSKQLEINETSANKIFESVKETAENPSKIIKEFQKGLEEVIDAYIYAFQAMLNDFLIMNFPIEKLKRKTHEEVSFTDYVNTYLDNNLDRDLSLTEFNNILFDNSNFNLKDLADRLGPVSQGMSSTFISAMPRAINNDDRLLVYKNGDSLLSAFKLTIFGPENNKMAFFEPYFMTYDFQPNFNRPDQFSSNMLIETGLYKQFEFDYKNKIFKSQPDDTESNLAWRELMRKTIDTKVYKVTNLKVSEGDIILVGSDGSYDNMPLGAMTIFLNRVVNYLLTNAKRHDELEQSFADENLKPEELKNRVILKIKEELWEDLEIIVADYYEFATTEENFSDESYAQLSKLFYLQRFRPLPKAIEEELVSGPADPNNANIFKRCTAYQIFFTRWIGKSEEARNSNQKLLSDCLRSVLKSELSLPANIVQANLFKRYDVDLISFYIAAAVKLLTLADNYVSQFNYHTDLKQTIDEKISDIIRKKRDLNNDENEEDDENNLAKSIILDRNEIYEDDLSKSRLNVNSLRTLDEAEVSKETDRIKEYADSQDEQRRFINDIWKTEEPDNNQPDLSKATLQNLFSEENLPKDFFLPWRSDSEEKVTSSVLFNDAGLETDLKEEVDRLAFNKKQEVENEAWDEFGDSVLSQSFEEDPLNQSVVVVDTSVNSDLSFHEDQEPEINIRSRSTGLPKNFEADKLETDQNELNLSGLEIVETISEYADENLNESRISGLGLNETLEERLKRLNEAYENAVKSINKLLPKRYKQCRESWLGEAGLYSPENMDDETAEPLIAISQRIVKKFGLAEYRLQWLDTEDVWNVYPPRSPFLSVFYMRYHISNYMMEFDLDNMGAKPDDITVVASLLQKHEKETNVPQIQKKLKQRLHNWQSLFTETLFKWFHIDQRLI